jgi:hypothetical protein
MSESTPSPAPSITDEQLNSIVEQITMDATILAFSKMSEGVLIGLDGCRDNGWDLNDRQKVEILQCLNFTFRDYESQLRNYAAIIVAMATSVLTDEDKKFVADMIEAAHKKDEEQQG